MAKPQEKKRARELRRKGWSIKSLARKLGVSSASASIWCRDIKLTTRQEKKITADVADARNKGRLLGAAANRLKKESVIENYKLEGSRELAHLSDREFLCVGLGIYWGEGSKADKNAIAVVNSDPRLICFAYKWFCDIFHVPKDMFRPQVFINHIHRARGGVVLNYWSELLGIPQPQFRKTVFIKTKNKKVYENHDSYYGVLALRIRKGTNLKYRILGYLNALGAQKMMPA